MSSSSTTNETRRRSRIVFPNDNNDDSSLDHEDVISIHSDSSSSNSSSSMEDFDTLWEQHVQQTLSHGEEEGVTSCLATQPAPTTENTSLTTSVTTSTQKSKDNTTSKSLEMTAFASKQDGHPSRVSLSPKKQNALHHQKCKPKSHVTMLEQVVTGAAAQNNKDEYVKSKAVEKKKLTSTTTTSKEDRDAPKLDTDTATIKDTVPPTNKPKSTTSIHHSVKGDSSVFKKNETKEKQHKSDAKLTSDSSNKTTEKKKDRQKAASSKITTTSKSDKKKKKRKKESAAISTSTSVKPNDADKRKTTTSPESTLVAENPTKQQRHDAEVKSSECKKKAKTKHSKPVMTSPSKNDKAAAATTTTTTSGTKRKSATTPTATSTKPPPLKKPKRTFQDAILLKMLLSCKPYTLKTLSHAMGSTEAAIHHVMLSLVDKGIVIKKEFSSKNGRSKELYWAHQSSTAKQVQALELPSREEMMTCQQEFASFQTKHSLFLRELQMVEQEPSNDDLEKQLVEMEQAVSTTSTQLQETKDRIAAFQQDGSTGIQNPLVLKKRINHMRDEWKDRKTKCRDFVDQLADGLEKPIKAVVKLLELETDEMGGVTMPPKYDVKK